MPVPKVKDVLTTQVRRLKFASYGLRACGVIKATKKRNQTSFHTATPATSFCFQPVYLRLQNRTF
jgi:hypothetical protein